MIDLLTRSGNLLQNSSFELDLAFWQSNNVATSDTNAAEGTQVARLGPGVASLYQDVALGPLQRKPLFLSLVVYTTTFAPGDLLIEVLWLNAIGNVIGTGLRATLPTFSITDVRNTFFDVTERPPLGAVAARLKFSRNASALPILLDLINLAPVETPNLIENPSFELGFAGWNSLNFSSNFSATWEGGAEARQSGVVPGLLTQVIQVNPFLPGTAYLLSFAAATVISSTVTARLIWLDVLGNPIGAPGIDATVVAATLIGHGKYLNIVQLSGPVPLGTVRARLEFTASGVAGSDLKLDQVILVRLDSPNLIVNSEFDNGLTGWTASSVGVLNTGGYVGLNFAQLASFGAFINQTVTLPRGSAFNHFLLNFALHYGETDGTYGNVYAQVHWLDVLGNEIGLGLAITVLQSTQPSDQWQVYTGFTERVPLGAASARIQFTKSAGSPNTEIGLDSVIFAKVD